MKSAVALGFTLVAMRLRVACFDPVVDSAARILILGSMPGEASLSAGQYYANARNMFWKIMGELVGLDPNDPYERRLEALKAAGIALWDVLRSCHRKGSLDAAIEFDSIEVNDFDAFFLKYPHIKMVCFNGATAERCYKKHVLRHFKYTAINHIRLPSTSPAHAALSLETKVAAWRAAFGAQQALQPWLPRGG